MIITTIYYLRHLMRKILLIVILFTLIKSVCLGQYKWNWRDPLYLNHFDWGDNKLLLYNGIGVGLTLKLTELNPVERKIYQPIQFSSYVDVLTEYSRSPISDVLVGRLRWTKRMRSFLNIGGDLSIYKVDDTEVDTEGFGTQIVFEWILFEKENFKFIFDNGVGPNFFREPFPFGGTQFNFTTFYGFMAQIRLPSVAWLSIGLKNIHISNAGISGRDRNPALDAWGLSVGYLFF